MKYCVLVFAIGFAAALPPPPPMPQDGHPFGPPPGGDTPGLGPGGQCRPPPTFRKPASCDAAMTMAPLNGGKAPDCLSMTIGALSGTKTTGTFNIYLFGTAPSAQVGADNFANMAIGKVAPQTSSGTYSGATSFVNLVVSAVFPQFITCNSSATSKEIVSYAASSGGRVIGKFDEQSTPLTAFLRGVWNMAAMHHYGVLCEVKPGPYYYIARNETELGFPQPEYRVLGMLAGGDMEFLNGVQKFLCVDYETVGLKSDCPTSGRRKRDSTDDYGFTSCSKK